MRRKRDGLALHELVVELAEKLEVSKRMRLEDLAFSSAGEVGGVANGPIVDLGVELLKDRSDARRSFPWIGALRAGGARNVEIAVRMVENDSAKRGMNGVKDFTELMAFIDGEGCGEETEKEIYDWFLR